MPRDEPEQVAKGVWRLGLRTPTLPPATSTNTLVVGSDLLAVIEPATYDEDERRRLDDLLDRLTAEGRSVCAVLLTHHHRDHTGDARRLADRHAVPIIVHTETSARLEFDADETIANGSEPGAWSMDLGSGRTLGAVHTPGHAPGHLVFIDEASGVVYGGDLVAGEGTILVDPEDGGDMAIYIQSLERMADHFRQRGGRLVPAHGPVIEDPVGLLTHYVKHRNMRERRVVDALERGVGEFDALLTDVYADSPGAPRALAAMSLRAHVEKLVNEGRAGRRGSRIVCVD